ncbi:hypothetical protein EYF80_067655 [Liparis tanakae]|uniref:Uncharacterized protein n=1 Tax=Liparis tanakae TaxID=230148 RepID=A0A4Z2E0B0_9TELE|nr:hypothetical protein EYF80_067655 [Liparis tanakae]
MAESKTRFVKENIFHCSICRKPQKNLSIHLTRSCMKASAPEEREVALAEMKLSGRKWVNVGRNWDYKFLETLIPDETSRLALLGEFRDRGFYVDNIPPDATAPAAAEQPSTSSPCHPAPSRPRHSRYLRGTRGVIECQRVLEVARLPQGSAQVSGFNAANGQGKDPVTDWVNRRETRGEVVLRRGRPDVNRAFALSSEEEAVSVLTS